jgi:hypothetical protein
LPKLPSELPWWFPRDFGGREITRPAGVQDRFKQYKFDRLFPDYNALAEAAQWHQWLSLKHEIEDIRHHAPIQGYVITEFTDINWEVNGLMDMWRNPKVYAGEIAHIQQPDVVLARLPKHNFYGGEQAQVEVIVSHYSARDLNSAKVNWHVAGGESGTQTISSPIARASVQTVQPITIHLPQVQGATTKKLMLELMGRDGSSIADNSYELYIYPPAAPDKSAPLAFDSEASSIASMRDALTHAGYNVAGTAGSSDAILISDRWDPDVQQQVMENGGVAILILSSADALPPQARVSVVPRTENDLDGNWVSNFNWALTQSPVFQGIAFNKILGWESEAVTPIAVMQQIPGEGFGDVLAGVFYGWLNSNSVTIVQSRVGAGKVLATTLRFDQYGKDPYATHLFDNMVRYVRSSAFDPQIRSDQ